MLVPPPGGVLPDAVEAELEGLCAAWGAEPYPGSPAARAALASVDAGAAVRALRQVAALGRRGPSGRTAGSQTLASAIVRAVAGRFFFLLCLFGDQRECRASSRVYELSERHFLALRFGDIFVYVSILMALSTERTFQGM
jgi:hypothetical protein